MASLYGLLAKVLNVAGDALRVEIVAGGGGGGGGAVTNDVLTDIHDDAANAIRVSDRDRVTDFYSESATLAAAGQASQVTLAAAVTRMMIAYTDKAIWVAKTEAKAEAAAGGALGDRVYVPAGGSGIVLPWSGTDIWFMNAVAAEVPTAHFTGMV